MSETSVVGLRGGFRVRRTHLRVVGGLVLAELVALTIVVLSWPRSGLYVSLTLRGQGGLGGTPLVLGWVAAMVLVAAASQVRPSRARPVAVGHFTVLQELLPTIAMVGVLAIAVARRPTLGDVFRIGNAVVLLVLFAAQQLVAVIERVRLANGLQETIVAGTAELSLADARFRSLVESSDDAIISATPDGLVTSWNAAAQRLLGYCGPEILGRPADLIIPEDERAEWVEIRRSFGKVSTRGSFETPNTPSPSPTPPSPRHATGTIRSPGLKLLRASGPFRGALPGA
jgi:PAS domain-containing protein